MSILTFVVPPAWDQKRLDSFLRQEHGMSGTTIKTARRIEEGLTQDGLSIRTIDLVRAGAIIRVSLPDAEREYRPYEGALQVETLYEDDALLIVNKPAGMPCHPSKGHPNDSLANAVATLPSMQGRAFRPIGRLDLDTSGTVLCAKHAHSAHRLGEKGTPAKKTYLALLCGRPSSDELTVDAPLLADAPLEDHRRLVCDEGLPAVTHLQVLHSNNGYTLAALWLETGRTHQIRAHMAHLGCPLAGDVLYGGDCSLLSRQALHCYQMSLYGEAGASITAFAPLPQDFCQALLACFGKNALDVINFLQKGQNRTGT